MKTVSHQASPALHVSSSMQVFSHFIKSVYLFKFFLQLSRPQCCWQTLMTSITSMMFTSSVSMNEGVMVAQFTTVLNLSLHTTSGFPDSFSSLGNIENLLGIILMCNVLILKVYQIRMSADP